MKAISCFCPRLIASPPERTGEIDLTIERLEDGDVVEGPDFRLEALHTPGHAPEFAHQFYKRDAGHIFKD